MGRVKHGMSRTSEYNSWNDMRRRCLKPYTHSYQWYGAKGIKVCQRWQDSFINFYADMGPKPTSKHQIDRIDSSGNYEPKNCRWVTASEQARNKGTPSCNTTGHKGISYESRRHSYVARTTIDGKRSYVGSFQSLDDAVTALKKAYGN